MRASALIAGLSLLLATTLQAKTFEGKVDYRITTDKGKTMDVTMSMSGSKTRTEMVAQGQGQAGAAIVDFKARTYTVLMPQRKAYMVQSFADTQAKAQAGKGSLSKTGATATIAGYASEEWVYQTDTSKTSLWITDKLGKGFFQSQGKGGAKFDIPAELKDKDVMVLKVVNGKGFSMEATKVSPGPVDPSLFAIPDGYTEMDLMGGASASGSGAASAPGASGAAGMGSIPPDAQARIQQAMQNMSPEQKAAMEKALQGQGGGQ
jgi:hypothetical protein